MFPVEDERAKICSNKDANDDVAIVVHGEQHDKVRHGELESVKQSSDGLLSKTGTESGHWWLASGRCSVETSACAILSLRLTTLRGPSNIGLNGCKSVGSDVLLSDHVVVFFACTSEKLETNDQKNDADAGASEGTSCLYVPAPSDEAGVDGVPVPQHRNLAASAHSHSSVPSRGSRRRGCGERLCCGACHIHA